MGSEYEFHPRELRGGGGMRTAMYAVPIKNTFSLFPN